VNRERRPLLSIAGVATRSIPRGSSVDSTRLLVSEGDRLVGLITRSGIVRVVQRRRLLEGRVPEPRGSL
jgi:hypothetical protein